MGDVTAFTPLRERAESSALLHTEKSERAQLFHRWMVVVMAEIGTETSDDSSSDNSTTSSEYVENTKVR